KLERENNKGAWKNLELSYSGRLSVSAFEKYHNCPFTFFTTRVLKQNELKELDLEIDPLFQGSFLHKILECVLVKYKNLDISEKALEALYVEVLESQEMSQDIRPDVLHYWKREKHRHLLMIRKFLVEERAWRLRLPKIHVDSLETAMSGFVGTENNDLSFSKEAKPGFFPFAAKIDRIDKDEQGNLAVYDYKTSKPGDFKSFEKWPETFQIQMPLYAMGLESGLSEPHAEAQVVSAGYIFLRDGSRGSGFVLQGIEHGFQAATTPKSKQNISLEDKDAVFAGLRLQLKDMIENIQRGQFAPVPLDEKDCPTCHWRKACRAPHLK
ncbi:MAG: PD-(D/E)XK nuclease family protein, partial [Bdellovibrionaceae bacterium]|nr:PD-(D/E)XK nuclease family protein [Pseudobdellovibrionaceae bacterium]